MSGDITFDHETIAPLLDSAKGSVPDGTGSVPANGVDPAITGSVNKENKHTGTELSSVKSDGDKTKDASGKLHDADKASSGKFRNTDADIGKDNGKPPTKDGGTHSADSNPARQMGSTLPSNQAGGPPAMPPMSGGGGTPSGGMPPLSQMTQYDMNHAPNRDQLVNQLRNMDPEHGGSVGALSNDPDGRRAQELAEKLVNHHPPIPYAWGGGHGATPGPSQGTHDGGYADQCGDYAKRGVDCSGLSRWITHQLYGIDIGGTSQAQYASGRPIDAAHARPGDIFFPNSAGRPPEHVQVYVGNNQVIEAQKSGTYLKFSPLQSGEFRRFAH